MEAPAFSVSIVAVEAVPVVTRTMVCSCEGKNSCFGHNYPGKGVDFCSRPWASISIPVSFELLDRKRNGAIRFDF